MIKALQLEAGANAPECTGASALVSCAVHIGNTLESFSLLKMLFYVSAFNLSQFLNPSILTY
jgi:hypothetical protein